MRMLALGLFVFLALTSKADEVVLVESFETLGEQNKKSSLSFITQFAVPDQVAGVQGSAWRSDGFSSWAQTPLLLNPDNGFSVSLWLALESYPSDLEVPADQLSPSSIFQQWRNGEGFDLGIDTYGRWKFRVTTTTGEVVLEAPERFPLWRWVHVAVSYDVAAQKVQLWLDENLIAESGLEKEQVPIFSESDFVLAKSHKEAEQINFVLNRLNGAFDELIVKNRPLQLQELEHRVSKGALADASVSLVVPETRFSGDRLRPKLHAMPPANWANEPHGFVRHGDNWHLFYQRTPNGPFKTQMHWGHMVSRDLVNWEHLPDALRPELQSDDFGFDMKGIWSGDVIVEGDKAFAFYTSVNHSHRLSASNPGIAMAVSEDPLFQHWKKLGPIINTKYVKDFRDPYLWREGSTWHMIIGAALASGGGLDYWKLDSKKTQGRWEHQKRFSAIGYRFMDPGSIIWEMPVFEPLTDDVYVLVVNPIGGKMSKYGQPATRGVYWTGTWKEGLFSPFTKEPKPLDILPGHLSPTVARAKDGALRAIGIVDERRTSQAQEDAGWAHTFSFPRRWFLMPDGETLGQEPAPELTSLRGELLASIGTMTVPTEPKVLLRHPGALEVEIRVADMDAGEQLGLDVYVSDDREEFTRITIDKKNAEVKLDLGSSTLSNTREGPAVYVGNYDERAFGKIRTVRVYIDGAIVEVFINDAAAFSFRSYPTRLDSTGVAVFSRTGALTMNGVDIWHLDSGMKSAEKK